MDPETNEMSHQARHPESIDHVNLHQRLENIRIAFENGDTPAEIVDVLNTHVENLLRSGAGNEALKVGDSAPDELIAWSELDAISLRDLFADHFLVLTWFRGNW